MPKSNKKEKKIVNKIDFGKAFIYVPNGEHLNFKGKNRIWKVNGGFFALGHKDIKLAVKSLRSEKYKDFVELSEDDFFKKYPDIPRKMHLKYNK